ncbi:MAG: ABC transporter permease [Rhodospirillaceae bacterium]
MNPLTQRLLRWSLAVKVSSLNRKLLRDLWRLKGQALAIAAVVGAGIALLIATLGCLSALQLSMDAFYERYRFADVFAPLKRAPNSLEERLRDIPGLAEVETRIVANITLDLPDMDEPAMGRLISVPDGAQPRLNRLDLRAGRLPAAGRTSEVVASEAFAAAHHLSVGNGIDATINGKRRNLTVVGVALTPEYIYTLAPGQFMPDDKRFGVLWMNRDALAAAYDLDEAFNDVVVRLQHGARDADVRAALDEILRPYGGIGSYARRDQLSHFFLSNELAQLMSTGLIAPPIFLAVAAFLLNIVVTRLVTTEREQIGLLKAFGYSDREVAWQYVMLVIALVSLGLLIGVLGGLRFGQAMIDLYAKYFKFPLLTFHAAPATLGLAALVSLGAGLAGGGSAVLRAARLSPAVAMAPPLPTAYRRTWINHAFEALKLSQPTRMIFRHVTRWPTRTALTSLGIGLAVATLVASLFFMDTARYVISVVFFDAQRQTATVSFVEPRAAAVEEQIRRLPGVLATQPVRTVSARLHNGSKVKRTAISGIVSHGALNRLLDDRVKQVEPPPGGVAMSRHMADELGLRLGDLVTVEVMQERRPVAILPVTRIVEQHMGFSAFMHIDALNRLMREGPTITGVHILADTREIGALYREIKKIPMISGIALMSAARAGFQDQMENTMYVMVTIYAGFATMIAFGVAYNSARIAFSERARALASLRVLGFTRAEAAYILLGELGIQTLIGLPLGCGLGYGLALLMSPILKTDMYDFPLLIGDSTYGFSVSVVLISACACGVLAGRRVYRLDLVSVLKTRE